MAISKKEEKLLNLIINLFTRTINALSEKGKVVTVYHFREIKAEPRPGNIKYTGAESIIFRINGGDKNQERELLEGKIK